MSVTAIIPNYNHARFLQRRLESIYNQTYPDLQVILLDDASTDNSREILEFYRHHPRTQTIVYNEVNSGSPFLQWKKGLDLVETEWVWIAESDDYCELDFLESLQPGLNKPACVLAYAQLNWVDEGGVFIKQASPSESAGWYNGKTFVQDHILGWNRLQNAGMLIFRKSVSLQANPQWMLMKQAGDYWLWAEIAAKGKVYGSGKPRCYITKHSASVSANQLYTQKAQDEIVDSWFRMLAIGSIHKKQLQTKIEDELVRLLCIRKSLTNSEFYTYWTPWKLIMEKLGGKPDGIWLKYRAGKSKLFHYLKDCKK